MIWHGQQPSRPFSTVSSRKIEDVKPGRLGETKQCVNGKLPLVDPAVLVASAVCSQHPFKSTFSNPICGAIPSAISKRALVLPNKETTIGLFSSASCPS